MAILPKNILPGKLPSPELEFSLLQELFQTSSDGFCIFLFDSPLDWNSSSDKESLLHWAKDHLFLVMFNQEFANQYEGPSSNLQGIAVKDLMPEDPEQLNAYLRDIFDKNKNTVTQTSQRSDGSHRILEGVYHCLFDKERRIIGVSGVQRDITLRSIREKSIEEANRLARIGGFEIQVKFRTLKWSPSLLGQMRIPESDPSPFITFLRRIPLSDRRRLILSWHRATRKKSNFSIPIEYSPKEGVLFFIHITAIIDYDIHGKPILITGLLRDLTESEIAKKKLQEERIVAEGKSQKKSLFLANMSHEIRTPLNSILGYTELLVEEPNLTGRSKSYLEIVKQSSLSLLGIINDILDFSKIESGKMEMEAIPFSIVDEIRLTVRVFELPAETKGLILLWDPNWDSDPMVVGDPHRLRQILVNLLSNAVKFTSQGTIIVSMKEVPAELPEMKVVQIQVRDTGIGIPEQKIQSIFSNYEQMDKSVARRFGGTGLGLAITESLVHLMGGKIEVQSILGQGTVFTIQIPFSLPKKVKIPFQAEQDFTGSFDPIYFQNIAPILIVDDNESNRMLLGHFLLKWKIPFLQAGSGAQAIQIFQTQELSMIFMDIQMPELDGWETTRRIRILEKRGSRIPIVAVTALAMKGDREKCLEYGIDDYVSKPYSKNDLETMIARFLTQST